MTTQEELELQKAQKTLIIVGGIALSLGLAYALGFSQGWRSHRTLVKGTQFATDAIGSAKSAVDSGLSSVSSAALSLPGRVRSAVGSGASSIASNARSLSGNAGAALRLN